MLLLALMFEGFRPSCGKLGAEESLIFWKVRLPTAPTLPLKLQD
jgi:hypothetical protein